MVSLWQFSHFSGRFFRAESGQVLGTKPLAVLLVQGTIFGFVSGGFGVIAQFIVSITPVADTFRLKP